MREVGLVVITVHIAETGMHRQGQKPHNKNHYVNTDRKQRPQSAYDVRAGLNCRLLWNEDMLMRLAINKLVWVMPEAERHWQGQGAVGWK